MLHDKFGFCVRISVNNFNFQIKSLSEHIAAIDMHLWFNTKYTFMTMLHTLLLIDSIINVSLMSSTLLVLIFIKS